MDDLDKLKQKIVSDPHLKAAYDALDDEFQLANELIKARIQNNYTQAQLADKTGLKQAAIARLESGQSNPSYKTLNKVAKALGKKVTFV